MTFILDEEVAKRARELWANICEAARLGVMTTVRKAMAEADCVAYERHPEQPNPCWDDAEAWISDGAR